MKLPIGRKELEEQFTQHVINNPTGPKLKILTKIMNLAIPFNIPHGFEFKHLSPMRSVIKLPKRRVNQNHLGTIHACAQVTLGEYTAGLLLIRNYGISDYRVILKDIHTKFSYQAKTELEGEASFDSNQLTQAKEELKKEGVTEIQIETNIKDKDQNTTAVVTTTWQLKTWETVRTPK